jgi:acetoin utilization deacetylase AcuC-like enzyme
MKKTGVFYHDVCGKQAYSSLAMGVEEGFQALHQAGIFAGPNVKWYESRQATEAEIRRLHSQEWIDQIKKTEWWTVSLHSVGGMLEATEKVLSGEINNALVIAGVGGHHAHRDNAWGGCYFNVISLGIPHARALHLGQRFAIVDTDTHHADGVRDLFQHDDDMLHICFCGGSAWEDGFEDKQETPTKICIPHGMSDDEEVKCVQKEVPDRIRAFKPELIYWLCGMDTHRDSYGTQALSEKAFPRMARIIKSVADEVCGGKLIVKTCCNAPPQATTYIVPRLVDRLAELNQYNDYE